MSTQTRQPGHYWVKRRADAEWDVAKWSTEKGMSFWALYGLMFQDSDFSQINEARIPSPDESALPHLGKQIVAEFEKKIFQMDKAEYNEFQDLMQQPSWVGKNVPWDVMLYAGPTVVKHSDGTTTTVFRSADHAKVWKLYFPDHEQ